MQIVSLRTLDSLDTEAIQSVYGNDTEVKILKTSPLKSPECSDSDIVSFTRSTVILFGAELIPGEVLCRIKNQLAYRNAFERPLLVFRHEPFSHGVLKTDYGTDFLDTAPTKSDYFIVRFHVPQKNGRTIYEYRGSWRSIDRKIRGVFSDLRLKSAKAYICKPFDTGNLQVPFTFSV